MRPGAGKIFSWIILFLLFWAGLRWLLPLTLPFLLGLGLALAAEPLVALLRRRLGLPRALGAGIGVVGAFAGLAVLILFLGAFLLRELTALGGILPDLEAAVRAGLALLEDRLLGLASHAPMSLQPLLYRHVTELFSGGSALLGEAGKYILSLAGGILSHVPDSFLTLGTALISGCMLSARLPQLRRWCALHLEREGMMPMLEALKRVRRAVGKWLLAQLRLAGVTLLILTLGLILLRVAYAPLWALGITLLEALPILGTGAVPLPWRKATRLQGSSTAPVPRMGRASSRVMPRAHSGA